MYHCIKGFDVGTSEGRPVGTTVEKEFGTSGCAPSDCKVGQQNQLDFSELITCFWQAKPLWWQCRRICGLYC